MEKYKFFLCGLATLIENWQTVKYFSCINLIILHTMLRTKILLNNNNYYYHTLVSKVRPILLFPFKSLKYWSCKVRSSWYIYSSTRFILYPGQNTGPPLESFVSNFFIGLSDNANDKKYWFRKVTYSIPTWVGQYLIWE